MTAAPQPIGTVPGLRNRWTDVLRRDTPIHLALMGSIVAGTLQGYLKDRFPGPIPYALADLCFVAAAALWFGGMAIRRAPIVRAPGTIPALLLIIIAVPTLYLLHPGTPLLIELAGLRGWVEFPVACLIALTVVRTPGQVRAYVGLILVLCTVTAAYGVLQYLRGPEWALGASVLAQIRHGSTVFYDLGGGDTDFRAFSTFTFPAPFAAMMVFGVLFGAGIAVRRGARLRDRLLVAVLMLLFFAGITVSGTRAALVMALIGLAVLGWYRGLRPQHLLLLPVLLATAHIATLLTAGRATRRFASILLDENLLWGRVFQPVLTAGEYLLQHPVGLGLGRTGVGVPFAIASSQPPGYFVFSDGDIGRAAVELGFAGLILLGVIVFGVVPHGARAMRALAHSDEADIALGAGALIVALGVIILVGSPLSTAPHGLIWWFLLGALLKLHMLQDETEELDGA